jgi:hypothetical protein
MMTTHALRTRCNDAARRNYINLASNQIGGQCWQSFVLATGEAILDRYVLTLNVAGFV